MDEAEADKMNEIMESVRANASSYITTPAGYKLVLRLQAVLLIFTLSYIITTDRLQSQFWHSLSKQAVRVRAVGTLKTK